MSFDVWLQVVAGVGTVVAIAGVNVGWRWAPVVGLATAPAWLIATARSGDWGMFAASVVCAASWAIGLYRAIVVPRKMRAINNSIRRVLAKARGEKAWKREFMTEPWERN